MLVNKKKTEGVIVVDNIRDKISVPVTPKPSNLLRVRCVVHPLLGPKRSRILPDDGGHLRSVRVRYDRRGNLVVPGLSPLTR